MKEIIISYLLSYVIIIASCFVYVELGMGDNDQFFNYPVFYVMIIFYIVVIIFLYKKNKRKELRLNYRKYFPLFYFGISIAVILNLIIIRVTNNTIDNNYPLLLYFISSGIVGPIYEEILFRYILFNRLRDNYSDSKALFISLIVFSLIHLSPIKIIYAFIIGFFITVIYRREKTILAPILVHIGANSIVILIYEFRVSILILAIINLVISSYLVFRQTKIS